MVKAVAIVLLVCACGCSGAFSSQVLDDASGGDAAAAMPDAAMPDAVGLPDAGSLETAQVDPVEAGRDAATESRSLTFVACELYYQAHAEGCSCVSGEGACEHFQTNDAGCGIDPSTDQLGLCSITCGWDGGAGTAYESLCDCVIACLGACAEPNELYFGCAVGSCVGSGCP